MSSTQYTGFIRQNIFNNATASGNYNIPLDFTSNNITWQSNNYANSLNLISLLENIQYDVYDINYVLDIIITGNQRYDDSSTPVTNFSLTTNDNNKYDKIYEAVAPGNMGIATYNINDSFGLTSYPTNLDIDISNRCRAGLPGCRTYNATNYNLSLILNITVSPKTTGRNLENYDSINQLGLQNTPQNITNNSLQWWQWLLIVIIIILIFLLGYAYASKNKSRWVF